MNKLDFRKAILYLADKQAGTKNDLINLIGSGLYVNFRSKGIIYQDSVNGVLGWKITSKGINLANQYKKSEKF